MTNTSLPSDIHFIQRGWFHSNHIVIEDPDGPILIDTGQHRGVEETAGILREEGIDPSTLQMIINTHCHTDHWGGNAYLHKLSNAPVVCGPITAEIFATNDTEAMWIDYFGIDDYDMPQVIPATRILHPGNSIQLGQYNFQIFAAPGHAPDSIAFFEPNQRILFCADTMFAQDCGVMNSAVSGLDTLDKALATLESFKALDATIALPGHGPMITDVAGNIEAVSQLIQLFQKRPDKQARHLCARSFIFSLLILQPISRDQLITMFQDTPWMKDNAQILKLPHPLELLNKLIQEFIQRGIVEDNNGILTTNVEL